MRTSWVLFFLPVLATPRLCAGDHENSCICKFALAGAPGGILGEGVLAAVHGYASGNPRIIDSLMTEALTLGAQLGLETLNTDIIMAATNNLALI